jgi:hypothetical protein
MKLRRAFLVALCTVVTASAGEIWVAPDGTDSNPGTREQPLASPSAALRQAREWRRLKNPAADDGITIRFRGGEYVLGEALFIRPEDSGTAERPTVLAAAPGEQPVFSGGVRLTGWQRLTKATGVAARLPESARAYVWVAELPLFHGRTLEFRQLWIDGAKAVRARWPNGDGMERLASWDRKARVAGIPVASPLPPDLRGVELVLLQAWEIAVLRVRSHERGATEAKITFHEPESRVQFEHPWPPPPMPGKDGKNAPFFLANAPEFLDAPGEWFADAREGRLYYWPREGEDLTRARVVAPAVEQLVRVAGTYDRPVRHVRLEGITFAHTSWLRPSLQGHVPHQAGFPMLDAYSLKPKGTPEWRSLDNQAWILRPPAAVSFRAAQRVEVRDCRFEGIAANALDAHLGVQDAVFEGNVFRDVGINGIVVGTFGEEGFEIHLPYDPTDEREHTARLRIANNVLRDIGNEDWGGIPIIAGFVRDTAIEHNDIYESSYSGISLGWGWTRTANVMRNNRVQANRLERIALRTADNAGIYTQSNQPGTVVSENAVFPMVMSPWVHDADHWFYLYTDEGSSFITVRDNWVPAEKFLENAIGPGNVWKNNGPHVDEAIKSAAGLTPEYRAKRAAELRR